MNSQNFFKNLSLAHESMKDFNVGSEEARLKFALEIALKLEELDLQNRQMALAEEEGRQKLELNYMEAKLKSLEMRNKHNLAEAEVLKSLIQSNTMLKSVWDNANINKVNALVGLFNSVMNAQNTSNLKSWETIFNEIKNACYAIGADTDSKNNTNTVLAAYKPLLDEISQALKEAEFDKANVKQLSLIAPKLELLKGESMSVRAVCGFESEDYGFVYEDKTYKSFTFLFEAKEVGEFLLKFYALNDKGQKIEDEIKISVLSDEKRL
ncbi:hypothetical protein [Campylobacter avium]|uniref:hypothetical protein n=1 Tax=Campylobacter avium TaxID=522485 RepID=UPI00248CA6A6|nr:hypothetical protein [Campylobacter avium]